MAYQHMDYSKSSTEAIAKEALETDELCQSIRAIRKEHGYLKPQLNGVYDYLSETHCELVSILFSRFVDTFGIRDYFEAHPDEDWLDNDRFIRWYQNLAKATSANESLHGTISVVTSWAERLNKPDDESKGGHYRSYGDENTEDAL